MNSNTLLNLLKKYENERIKINQEGFLINQFYINSLKISEKEDIVTLYDEENLLEFNMNQTYNIDGNDTEILLYLDNDIKIKIRKV